MQHQVKLSNGETVVLREGDNELHIGQLDGNDVDWWIATISANGVLVAPNSSYAPEELTRKLEDHGEQPYHPRVISLYLYDDGSDEAPTVVIDPPDNFGDLVREWQALDDQYVSHGQEPDGWKGFSEWMRDRGVNIPETEVDNLENYREG